ncbi:Podocan [Candida viswanathii]|uniref:Podocan n=1 Tax=Candida viswanathii TaxID=5486 RepID=A0A367YBW9_9ASCO|nr:Podocan [Candida viswanathii]
MSLFLTLPAEILQLVFAQIPNRQLDRLKDISEIKRYVLAQLYSLVVIEAFHHKTTVIGDYQLDEHIELEIADDDYTPSFADYNEYVDFLEENPFVRPGKMDFEQVQDLFKLHLSRPELLQGCKIVIHLETELEEPIFQELKALPYPIDQIMTIGDFFDEEYFDSGDDWYDRIRCITIDFGGSLDLKCALARLGFKSLRELDLSELEVEEDKLKYIPRHVRYLKLELDLTDNKFLKDFPPLLETLDLELSCTDSEDDDGNLIEYDISHLQKLKVLVLDDCEILLKFPPSLKELQLVSGWIDLNRVKQQCPELESLRLQEISWWPHVTCPPQCALPDSLVELFIGTEILLLGLEKLVREGNAALESSDNELRIDFLPKTLRKLMVFGEELDYYDEDSEFLKDRELCLDLRHLCHLRELSLDTSSQYFKIENYPASLKRIYIESLAEFDTDGFKDLSNLIYVSIKECEGQAPIELATPYLRYLDLSSNTISNITSTNFVIPSTVHEIDLSHNDDLEIEETFEFPTNLQVLLLKSCDLRRPPKLPPNLKSLSLAGNYIAELQEFPPSLRVLELEGNEITEQTLSKLDLKSCTYLKVLNLSSNNVESLLIQDFPKSLTHLFLNDMGIKRILGSFAEFPDLEEIGLSQNLLSDYFVSEVGRDKELFGNGIKVVWLDRNELTSHCAQSIMRELIKKPKFRCLNIGQQTQLAEIDDWVDKVCYVQNEE